MHKAIDLKRPEPTILVNGFDDDYPHLHISNVDNSRLLEMPDTGEATIKFKVVSRSHDEHDRGGKKEHRCSLTLEVQKIDFEDNPKTHSATNLRSKNGKGYGEDARKNFSDFFKDK